MYMTYGWPQVIPLESSNCPTSEQIIYLKVLNRLLLVVAPSHLELWSSGQVTLPPPLLYSHFSTFQLHFFILLVMLFVNKC